MLSRPEASRASSPHPVAIHADAVHHRRRRWRPLIRTTLRFALPAALLLVLAVLTGCSAGATGAPAAPPPSAPEIHIPTETAGLAATAPGGRGAIRPLPAPSGCTATGTDPASAKQALDKAAPGDKVCITGDLSNWRMKVNYSGTEQAPVQVVGDGHTRVNGIDVEAGNVIVDGFTVLNAKSPEVAIAGNNVTLRNTVARNPTSPGSDNVTFSGDNIKILHNTLGHISGNGTPQANCIDAFTSQRTGQRPSHHVQIDNNRCENAAYSCLRALGPRSPGGVGGQDQTTDFSFTNNYCQTRGQAAVVFDDVQNATITNNVVAQINHAWSLQNNATGAKISGNTIAPGTGYEVGIDDSSQPGYQGPPSGGTP
ncbi:hypothetical protein ACTXG6_33405 [Pseudonocardia sp. Cha107L01]|uniref:hypothetical protein n=1 Tax=Pseudonocardia sp. Cha107L01 TaxID=3457576 RepID=UPI00403E58F2